MKGENQCCTNVSSCAAGILEIRSDFARLPVYVSGAGEEGEQAADRIIIAGTGPPPGGEEGEQASDRIIIAGTGPPPGGGGGGAGGG